MTPEELLMALAEPFQPHEIRWRVVATNKDKTKALVVPYYDVRLVYERLDKVVGLFDWQIRHVALPGGGIVTELGIRQRNEQDQALDWVWKGDVGYVDRDRRKQSGGQGDAKPSDEELAIKIKGDATDGAKRAAQLWGIGRVYWLVPRTNWLPYNAQYRKVEGTPTLPKWAMPYDMRGKQSSTELAKQADPETGELPPPPDDIEGQIDGDGVAEEGEGEPVHLAQPSTDRPYAPPVLKSRLAESIGVFERNKATASKAQMGTFMGMLRMALSESENPDDARRAVLKELFGVSSGTDLSGPQIQAGLKWANPSKGSDNTINPDDMFVKEAKSVYRSVA
jgi:hypothetical protein